MSDNVTKQSFLDADLKNFRYEKSGEQYTCRLFHCKPDGSSRFALYFHNGGYSQINNEPFSLSVWLSNVDISPNEIKLDVVFKENGVHHALSKKQNSDEDMARKVCEILNYHQPSCSMMPD